MRRAFTLIELLTVVAIMCVLGGAGALAMRNAGTFGADVANGGSLVADLAVQARQNSVSRDVMTALVMEPGGTAFVLVQRGAGTAAWSAVTRWNLLPRGVAVASDPGQSTFLGQNPSVVIDALPRLSNATVSPSACAYQVFLPDGRLSTYGIANPVSPRIRIVPAKGNAVGYCDVVLNSLTGMARMERP